MFDPGTQVPLSPGVCMYPSVARDFVRASIFCDFDIISFHKYCESRVLRGVWQAFANENAKANIREELTGYAGRPGLFGTPPYTYEIRHLNNHISQNGFPWQGQIRSLEEKF